jgi:CRISPR-associated protein Csb1
MTTTDDLYNRIRDAVSGPSNTAGIRISAAYEPAAGPGSKIYPPTFPLTKVDDTWKRYLVDKRFTGESGNLKLTDTVLVDSIQSQSNRWEEAVQDAIDAAEIAVPVLDLVMTIDGTDHHITNLVAPHRSVDAYFRDAELDSVNWESTAVGKAMIDATPRTARSLYEQAPTDLILGHWDSQRGTRRSRKVARAYSSEMIGLNPQAGRSAAVRLDPFEISSAVKIEMTKGSQVDWELSKTDKGKKPSEANLGNAPSTDEGGKRSWIGTAVDGVERVAFISFAALQRLSFPELGTAPNRATDAAARAVLASLALYGDRRAFASAGLFLRSGCDLVLRSEVVGFVGIGAIVEPITLDESGARELLEHAIREAAKAGIAFGSPISLTPKQKLVDLITKSLATFKADDEDVD